VTDDQGRVRQALDAIDFEIEQSRLSTTGGGSWSVWTVLAALAAIFWLFSDVVRTDVVSAQAVMRLFLVGSLGVDVVLILGYTLSIYDPVFPPRQERRLTQSLLPGNSSSTALAADLAKSAALLTMMVWLGQDMPRWVRNVAVLFFCLPAAMLFLIMFGRRLFPGERVGYTAATARITKIVFALVVVLGGTALGGLIAHVILGRGPFSLADVRCAGLLVALAFLLTLLSRVMATPRTLGPLVDVRRDLALGRIRPDMALKRIDVIVAGQHIADAIEEWAAEVRTRMAAVDAAYQSALWAGDALATKYQKQGKRPSASEISKWAKVYERRIARRRRRLRKEYLHWTKRTLALVKNDSQGVAVGKGVSDRLSREVTEAIKRWNESGLAVRAKREALLKEGDSSGVAQAKEGS
jgi:hypothetical protein